MVALSLIERLTDSQGDEWQPMPLPGGGGLHGSRYESLMDQPDEPLDPQSWIAAITRLHDRAAADDEPTHHERYLRSAHTLSRLAPAALGDIFASEASEAEYDEFLRSSDLYNASIELLNPALKLVIAKPDGTLNLEVHAPIFDAFGIANDVFPRAIVLAWTQCVMAMADRVYEIESDVMRPGLHTRRSEPHPPSSSH